MLKIIYGMKSACRSYIVEKQLFEIVTVSLIRRFNRKILTMSHTRRRIRYSIRSQMSYKICYPADNCRYIDYQWVFLAFGKTIVNWFCSPFFDCPLKILNMFNSLYAIISTILFHQRVTIDFYKIISAIFYSNILNIIRLQDY